MGYFQKVKVETTDIELFCLVILSFKTSIPNQFSVLHDVLVDTFVNLGCYNRLP